MVLAVLKISNVMPGIRARPPHPNTDRDTRGSSAPTVAPAVAPAAATWPTDD